MPASSVSIAAADFHFSGTFPLAPLGVFPVDGNLQETTGSDSSRSCYQNSPEEVKPTAV